MSRIIVFLFCALAASACSQASNYSDVKTDLGKSGSDQIAKLFGQYKSKTADHCYANGASGTKKRVMITGFGPWQSGTGSVANISGSVVRTMAKAAFWSEDAETTNAVSISLDEDDGPFGWANIGAIINSPGDFGGRALQRSLTVSQGGQVIGDYEACLIMLDVEWDLAAAIILHEMQSFQPDILVMSGLGGAV